MQSLARSKPPGLLLFALVALQACSRQGGPTHGASLPEGTNLLLVTLDTTRADRIGSYGHAAARTPHLDALARDGVRFERAYAHVPLTLPTHASLLTGTLPPEHGIHDNGRRALGPQLVTLAEVYSARGYRTAAFVSAIALDASFGLDRGFETYDDALDSGAPGAGRSLQRPGDQTTERALEWLTGASLPFFLWVHYYDAHADYTPHASFELADAYDGEIAFVDAQLGRLLAGLESRALREQSLVVVLADHGESLGEKGEHTHASLIYDGTQHIPLVFSMPTVLPGGLRVESLVGQSDLFPTLMELHDWSVPAEVSGRSFAPLLRGESREEGSVWLESEYAALNFGWSPLHGIVYGPWKYVQAPAPELYHLLDDPRELHNLASRRPQVVRELAERLRALQASMGSYASRAAEPDEGLARSIAALGYAQARANTGAASGDSSINPIEHIATLEQYHAAIGFSNRGEFERMLAPLQQVARAFPEAPAFRTQLGDVYRRLGRLGEARLELQAALELDPSYDPAHFYLAELERLEGHGAAARAAYLRVLQLRPSYVPARERLGESLALAGEASEALPVFQALAQEDPSAGRYWLALAELHGSLQHPRERLASLERAAIINSDDLGTQNLLAWVLATSPLAELRDPQRALQLAHLCVVQSAHEHPEPLLTLAAAQAASGQFELAQSTLAQALELASASRSPEYVEVLRAHAQTLDAKQALRDG